jgi:hypothetical protein
VKPVQGSTEDNRGEGGKCQRHESWLLIAVLTKTEVKTCFLIVELYITIHLKIEEVHLLK